MPTLRRLSTSQPSKRRKSFERLNLGTWKEIHEVKLWVILITNEGPKVDRSHFPAAQLEQEDAPAAEYVPVPQAPVTAASPVVAQ
jgi:hypothetical protein